MPLRMDSSNQWGVRWFSFFIILTAFIIMMVVIVREHLVLGKITDHLGATCLIAEGQDDELTIGRTSGIACASSNAIFAVRNDLRNSPIVFRETFGPPLCLTDDRRSPVVTLELCVEDQPNQRWHLSNHHLLSDAAIHVAAERRCVASSVGYFMDAEDLSAKPLTMEVCRHSGSTQLFGFLPLGSKRVE
jgi:hypothetical protein